MAKRISHSTQSFSPGAFGHPAPGHSFKKDEEQDGYSSSSSSSSSSDSDRESIDDEVERARRLGELASRLAEDSKGSDFGRQKEADATRYSYERRGAFEDNEFQKERMDKSSWHSRLQQSEGDAQQRGRMSLGADLEQRSKSNALNTALSVLSRFR
jgi:hypothetical protein